MQSELRILATAMLTGLFGVAGLLLSVLDTGSGASPGEVDGRLVYLTNGCNGCHTVAGLVEGGNIGPDLTELGTRAANRVVGLAAEAYVRQSILTPQAFEAVPTTPMGQMPAIPMADDELEALIAFLLPERR